MAGHAGLTSNDRSIHFEFFTNRSKYSLNVQHHLQLKNIIDKFVINTILQLDDITSWVFYKRHYSPL